MLRDIVEIDTSVSLLGATVTDADHGGADRAASLFHAEGERATARGAAAAGALYVMSTSGATLVEDVAKERGDAAAVVPALHAAASARRPARCSTAAHKAGFRRWC